MSFLVRLYGSFNGHDSAASVTSGWSRVLQERRLLGGTFSMRNQEYCKDWGAAMMPVALVTDIKELPSALGNEHNEVHVVLATHSNWAPAPLLDCLRDPRVTVLATSQVVMQQVRCIAPSVAVQVVAHGIDPAFFPLTGEQKESLKQSSLWTQLRGEGINFLHMCESSMQRKGTFELLRAFSSIINKAPPFCSLAIVASAEARVQLHNALSGLGKAASHVRIIPRLNAPPDKLRWVYACFDAIVQPSRAEGFGLCPLEGLCMGIPCAITTDCGHREWAVVTRPAVHRAEWSMQSSCTVEGVMEIASGPSGEPLFEPAPAPVVRPQDIEACLDRMLTSVTDFATVARAHATHLRSVWNWPAVTSNWCEKIRETYA